MKATAVLKFLPHSLPPRASRRAFFLLAPFVLSFAVAGCKPAADTAVIELQNVSYDPTREFYVEFNRAFIRHWNETKGQNIKVEQSHGGAAKQARAVIDGLPADVVTLAIAYDIDQIAARAKLLPADWQSKLPNNSCPYTSTIVFLVRAGNPKQINDWDDLAKPGVEVITPNPKTSGGARYNYLAAWGFAKRKGANEAKTQEFVASIFRNAPSLPTGARGATTTFMQQEIGDVLITWENEALLALKEAGDAKVQIVVPSLSIRAEPPVAVVEANAQKNGKAEIARAYLEYLYTPVGQRLAAKHFFRPQNLEHADPEDAKRFQSLEMVSIDEFGGWAKAQETHFNDGGIFDRIYAAPQAGVAP